MACSGPTLHKSPFVLQLNLKMGQISVWLDPSLMSQFHIWQILGFGLDPLPPFGTMSLNPVFFYFEGIPNIDSPNSIDLDISLDID